MFSKATSALAALALLSTSYAQSTTASADQSTSTACPSKGGVHVIVARGSLEAPPYGVLVSVKDSILAQLPGSTSDGTIGYPDTLNDYQNSETAGAIVARGLINDYVSRCPGLPLAVLGYSQGANVLGDALVGQDDMGFMTNSSVADPLPASTLSQVAAVILMGDPTFNTTETFLAGNATRNGDFPRHNVEDWNIAGLASRTQSYCDENDLFCAGGNSIIVHVSYVQKYGVVAASYVVNQVKSWYSSGAGSSASGVVPKASASASRMASAASATASGKVSACQSASSRVRTATASASVSRANPSATQSAPASTSSAPLALSSNSASSLEMTGAAAGAAFFGIVAALL